MGFSWLWLCVVAVWLAWAFIGLSWAVYGLAVWLAVVVMILGPWLFLGIVAGHVPAVVVVVFLGCCDPLRLAS